ncbi:MAG TPA: carboxypeptidase-like regulatory domain-containing protein [Chitinophagales bacterium]|nr:carboxypeptidase-like regulatory domain-containing protein [Chitinophagales bacterium]
MIRVSILFFFLAAISCTAFSQSASVYGNIRDETGQPLGSVSIKLSPGGKGVISDQMGNFDFEIPSEKKITIIFSHLGFDDFIKEISLHPGQRFPLYVVMNSRPYLIDSVTIEDRDVRNEPSMVKIDPKKFESLPSAGGGVEAILKVMGAQSNNEMSSQYSVRGGNYDENLVYVNDFEIFRPFLVRNSQQEGLSFINPDLTGSLAFSSGGFQPKYGDKMSSVLDIEYKRPTKFAGIVSGSLLGGSLGLEGATKNRRFRFLFGARYKTNQYLLNSLDVSGNYRPTFTDIQGDLQYDLSDKVTVEAIGNYSGNTFQFVPESRTTTFGTIQQTLRLTVFFDGQEVDRYDNGMGGLSLTYKPRKNLQLKFLSSYYQDREDETYDEIGQYFLGEVGTNFGSSTFGQTLYYIGVGTTHEWARDFLDASVYKFSHKGSFLKQNHFIQWGADYNHEIISDNISEWTRQDSAGYTLPYSDSVINIQNIIRTTYDFSSNRYSGYLQDSWALNADRNFTVTYGARVSYWDFNNQFIVSPRLQFSYQPHWKRDLVFRVAAGAYDQPPFYRELRDLYGVLHDSVLAQRSIHYVVGVDYDFQIWDRPFKFVTEVYYKQLYDLNPYEIDNVRIRYFGTNDAKGYSRGIDLRLNGEFVQDAESWISLSLLQTRENLSDDFLWTVDTVFHSVDTTWTLDSTKFFPGYIPRPTDQFLNFAMFFQDYIPGNETFKVHLSLIFGTGLPTGPPDYIRARDTLRLAPYRRVDIGFSALLLDGKKPKIQQKKFWNHFESIWLDLEIFNMLGVPNVISYTWVKTQSNIVYAVPNYLTGRRVNLKLQVKF